MKEMRMVRKGLLETFFIVPIAIFLFTSIASADQWAKTYGGDSNDVAYSIQQTQDGGYIVAGSTSSSGQINENLIVLKLNSDVTTAWQRTFSHYGSHSVAKSIQKTSDGGYIVTGYDADIYGADVWVLKLNSNGTVAWQKNYGGGAYIISNSYSFSIQQTLDNGYIVAGETDLGGEGSSDAWILKLDENGDLLWQKTYGGTRGDNAYSIQQTLDGGYIVAGSTSSFGTYPYREPWVFKLDGNGNIQWQKTYDDGTADADTAHSIQQTSDGGYIVACSDYVGSYGSNGNTLLIKLDQNGNTIWQKIYGVVSTSMQQTADGGCVIAGSIVSSTKAVDIWILKLNSDGTVDWQKTFGGSGFEFSTSIQQTMDGGYIVGGYSGINVAYNDILILKLDGNGEIPYCSCIEVSNATVENTNAIVSDVSAATGAINISQNVYGLLSDSTSFNLKTVCPGPVISASPDPINFGSVEVGTSSVQTVRIINEGVEDLVIGSPITIEGKHASNYSIQNDNCSEQILEPSETCMIDVVFLPVSRGLKEANLSMPSNDPGLPTLDVPINGAGRTGNITVLTPNGGEIMPSGSTYAVQWWAREDMVKFDLMYSLNNGKTWTLIVNNVQGTSYTWNVPTPTNNKKKCRFKVIGYNDSGVKIDQDISDATFMIEVVTVIWPNGGETLQSNSLLPIIWKTNITVRPIANVKLLYTMDGGATWRKITLLTSNPESYNWRLPTVTTIKTQCKVKVVLKDASNVTVGNDVSDGVFTIQP